MSTIDYMKSLKDNDISALVQYVKTHDVNEEVQGQSLLYWAVFYNSLDFSKKLIEMGADVNHKDSLGRSLLSISCFFGFVDLTRSLLKNGAVIDITCVERASYGLDGNIQTDILKLLREYESNK